MASPLAGNWDPTEFNKVFPAGESSSFYGNKNNSYADIVKKYKGMQPPQPTISGEYDLVSRALSMAYDPVTVGMQAEIEEARAQRASELSRQNMAYAVGEQSKYESERDKRRLQYGMLASIPGMIGEAFAAHGKYALLGSQMGTQSLANVLNTPSANFQSVSPQYQKYLS
jgi:hypothetical protein